MSDVLNRIIGSDFSDETSESRITFEALEKRAHNLVKKRQGVVLTDQIAIVTGASRGLGFVTAEVLSSRGARVALIARSVSDLERVAANIQRKGGYALAIPCNVIDNNQVEGMVDRVVKEWGQIDILINNAGVGSPIMPVEKISLEEWDHTMDMNLKSTFICTRSVAPVMKRQAYGRIVNMSSYSGRFYSRFLGSPYAASKAGILGFTRQMAVELGPYGICVNAVAPNFTLNERAKAKWGTLSDEERRRIISGIPLRRLALPEEIAAAIAFLASDDASYINGICLDVNGGSYMI